MPDSSCSPPWRVPCPWQGSFKPLFFSFQRLLGASKLLFLSIQRLLGTSRILFSSIQGLLGAACSLFWQSNIAQGRRLANHRKKNKLRPAALPNVSVKKTHDVAIRRPRTIISSIRRSCRPPKHYSCRSGASWSPPGCYSRRSNDLWSLRN